MENILTRIAHLLIVVPGPLLPALIAFLLWRKRPHQARIFLGGVLSLLIFSLFVAVPYYFQGYAEPGRVFQIGEGLGWTRNRVIGFFAYWYTIDLFGFLWLVLGMLMCVFGKPSEKQWISAATRTAAICAFGWYLFIFHRFHETIHAVLE